MDISIKGPFLFLGVLEMILIIFFFFFFGGGGVLGPSLRMRIPCLLFFLR